MNLACYWGKTNLVSLYVIENRSTGAVAVLDSTATCD